MILTPLFVLIPLFAQADKPLNLNRVFVKGEKLQYEVKAGLHLEKRELGLNTWIPSEQDYVYKFTSEVTDMKADGIAEMKYLRPTMTEILGETAESAPQTKDLKQKINLLLTISPINELLTIKDLDKKPDDKKKKDEEGDKVLALRSPVPRSPQQLENILFSLNNGLGGMVLFIGSLDSCLDFAPKLPFEEVTVGYSWKRTGGYSPQKLAGDNSKMAVQRLDYVYTYKGEVVVDGKKYLRVVAELNLDTSIADYIHQMMNAKPKDTGLKALPFKLKSTIEFDLDPVNRRTVRAVATSFGEAQIMTVMKLLSAKP
jgi:hypothetical protein